MTALQDLPRYLELTPDPIKIEPYQFVKKLSKDEQLAILHAICSESILPIAEVRAVVNGPGYNDI